MESDNYERKGVDLCVELVTHGSDSELVTKWKWVGDRQGNSFISFSTPTRAVSVRIEGNMPSKHVMEFSNSKEYRLWKKDCKIEHTNTETKMTHATYTSWI